MTNSIIDILALGQRFLYQREYRASLWEKWGNFTIPQRPNSREIAIYKNFVGAAPPHSQVAVYGATSEFRDMLSELKIQPILIDISLPMLVEMLRYTNSAKEKNEIWIKGDWFTAPLPDNFFDIAIGDLFLRHVDPEKQEELLAKISKSLKADGKLIVRTHAINPSYRHRPYREILEEMRSFPYQEKKYEAMGILLSRLFDASTKNCRTDHDAIIAGIKMYLRGKEVSISYGLFLHEFLAKRLALYAYARKALVSETQPELEELLKKYFSITAVRSDDSYPESQFFPIYLLEKKRV